MTTVNSDEMLNYWYKRYNKALDACKKRELIIITKDEQLLKLKEALVKVSLHCECFRFEERYPIQETIREALEELKGN